MDNQGRRYDNIAVDFASLRNSFSTEKKYVDQFIHLLEPNSHILDVGCGSGYPIASYLLQRGFQVTGVDGSNELLKIARKNLSNMQCILGDMRTVELAQKYDAIIEWWALMHL